MLFRIFSFKEIKDNRENEDQIPEHQMLFCEMGETKLNEQGNVDKYSCDASFPVLHFTVQISDEKISTALNKLSEKQRAFILLYYFHDMSDKEIAKLSMDNWLDAIRLQIIQQKNPDANDLYLKILEGSHIQEEEYFFHTIHSDWDNIIRTIHENHEHVAESAPIERPMSNNKKVLRFLQTLKFKNNPSEEFWRFFCDEMQIPFDHLSVDEHKVMKDVFMRSKLLKALPNRKRSKK